MKIKIEMLNRLLRINNDRIAGYKKAARGIGDFGLKKVFKKMADVSRQNASELIREIDKFGGIAAAGSTTLAGKIYRLWMGIKGFFTDNSRKSVLHSCEHEEIIAEQASLDVIASSKISGELRQLVRNQQAAMAVSHDLIIKLRE